ncbi:MAG: glycine C-acetyltransferase, partial [Proteobacteria bacterium]|nr:glycine C-acetyltransferase [Pseudomonadota bacterium]
MTALASKAATNTRFETSLKADLAAMEKAGTLKTFRHIQTPMDTQVSMAESGKALVLSSNNYLGLANHPEVIEAGLAALKQYGAGTASVRFICGTFTIHEEIEAALARLHHTESALTYVSCWAANTGLMPAIAGAEDVLVSDELNHASLIDGCRMSKAKRYVYKHSDMADLEEKLKQSAGARRTFIVTDGVFSMEGDIVKLPEVLALARKYNAVIILDDSHGVGVMGKHGRGCAEHFGVEGQVDIITGTLGKALGGAAGGYVAGPKALIDYLQQTSRPQLFSNALPATIAGSAMKAIEILNREPQRVARLHALTAMMREGLQKRGFKPLHGESAIVPIIVGDTAFAIKMSQEMLKEGIYITGFGYPVVPEGTARLRIQICASLTDEQINFALDTFEK